MIRALREHLAVFAQDDPGALVFPGAKGGPLRRGNFNKMSAWPHAVESIGVPGLHFHDLRHTGNQFAAYSGARLRDLMARMGHDSERAAMIYQNSQELHQTGENPQVAMSERYSSGLSRVLGVAA